GGALGTGDRIKLSNFSLSIARPHDREDVTQAATDGTELSTDFPVQNDDPEIVLSITVPDYTTLALLDDVKTETVYKASLNWARTVGSTDYIFLIELGNLHPTPQDIGAEGRGRFELTRTFRGLRPPSTPTGFAIGNPIHITTSDNFASSYELG
ncbi:hypothetical protein LCGC14_3076460, partial [marine sediment metagenome]